MKLDEKQLPEFMQEMRNLLGNIKGAKGLNETFSLSYIVMVEDQESKENVEKIANLLTEQAAKEYAIDLEIAAATAEEMKEAAEKYKEYQASKNGSFVL
jgi:uncharacterized protein YigA (DUF484 family)